MCVAVEVCMSLQYHWYPAIDVCHWGVDFDGIHYPFAQSNAKHVISICILVCKFLMLVLIK